MLKRRIVAALVVKDDIVVQSFAFGRYLPVGTPEIAAEFLNQWGVDEIMLLDISATRAGRTVSTELVKRVSKKCLVPLAVGGGIKRLGDIDALLQAGADKVCLNRSLFEAPTFITEAAHKFGNQCVVASVDVSSVPLDAGAADQRVYNYLARCPTTEEPVAFCAHVESLGAGEVLLNAVHRDGGRAGFDVSLIRAVSERLKIPVIALGGAGHPDHFQEVLDQTRAQAVCAANFFHYAEHSVITTKASLVGAGQGVRLETKANYQGAMFDGDGRLRKKPDEILERLLYVRVEKEVI